MKKNIFIMVVLSSMLLATMFMPTNLNADTCSSGNCECECVDSQCFRLILPVPYAGTSAGCFCGGEKNYCMGYYE